MKTTRVSKKLPPPVITPSADESGERKIHLHFVEEMKNHFEFDMTVSEARRLAKQMLAELGDSE